MSYRKANKPMSKTQKIILALLSLAACLLVTCFISLVGYNSLLSQPTSGLSTTAKPVVKATNNNPISSPDAIKDDRLWIIYEVMFLNNPQPTQDMYAGETVTITWANNTGGTDQREAFIGDGSVHTWFSPYGTQGTTISKPFHIAYTANQGDYFSILAQSGESRTGNLKCNIYLSDAEGAECMVKENRRCGNIQEWLKSTCGGQFCICQTSGFVGN